MKRLLIAVPLALLLMACVVTVLGCATATVDRTQAQAREGAPVSAEVPVLVIPYDVNQPRFVVAVDTLAYSASGQACPRNSSRRSRRRGTFPWWTGPG